MGGGGGEAETFSSFCFVNLFVCSFVEECVPALQN